MKTTRFLLTILVTALVVGFAQAEESKKTADNQGKSPCAKATATGKKRKVVVTGSAIPVEVGPDGKHPVPTASPVVVLTQEEMRRLGARDLADVLRRGVPSLR
jgi:hypothetical protein